MNEYLLYSEYNILIFLYADIAFKTGVYSITKSGWGFSLVIILSEWFSVFFLKNQSRATEHIAKEAIRVWKIAQIKAQTCNSMTEWN